MFVENVAAPPKDGVGGAQDDQGKSGEEPGQDPGGKALKIPKSREFVRKPSKKDLNTSVKHGGRERQMDNGQAHADEHNGVHS